MSRLRNIEESRRRALRALDEHPDWDLKDIARHIGISRVHLYRLARRFPEVQAAYKFALDYKDMEALETTFEAAMGHRVCNLRLLNRLVHRGMKNRYYLSRWEARETREPRVIFEPVSDPDSAGKS